LVASSLSSHLEAEIRRALADSDATGFDLVGRMEASRSRAELLRVLMLPDFDRADAIGSYWVDPKTRTFAELLIDCE
jgi:hypothetical protein